MSVATAASGVGGTGVPSSLGSVGGGPVFPLSLQQQSQQMRSQPISPNRFEKCLECV